MKDYFVIFLIISKIFENNNYSPQLYKVDWQILWVPHTNNSVAHNCAKCGAENDATGCLNLPWF